MEDAVCRPFGVGEVHDAAEFGVVPGFDEVHAESLEPLQYLVLVIQQEGALFSVVGIEEGQYAGSLLEHELQYARRAQHANQFGQCGVQHVGS